MSEHTPGPWVYDDDTATIDNDLGVSVAGINVDLDNYEANARVIAATPDLLEALREMASLGPHALVRRHAKAQAKAIAALEKAEGRQP